MSIPGTVYKAHATGNDFVVYADPEGVYEPTVDEVRWLCDRHFGIGADGLIRLAHPADVHDLESGAVAQCERLAAAWFMDYRNADGSIAQMCGNGTRAITLFAQRQGYAGVHGGATFVLGTRSGVKTLTSLGDVEPYGTDVFRIDMGPWRRGPRGAHTVTVPGTQGAAAGTFVDMGNPHIVALLQGGSSTLPALEALNLQVKPLVDPALDSGQNVEFVRIDAVGGQGGAGEASMRVHERGVGETLSCGTGLCAAAVNLRAETGIDHWNISVRGGVLRVDVTDATVLLTGSSAIVGRIDLLTHRPS